MSDAATLLPLAVGEGLGEGGPPAANALLSVEQLQTHFGTPDGVVRAVEGLSPSISTPGRTVAIVGESGCGKSVTSMSILRLITTPPGKHRRAPSCFNGRNLLRLARRRHAQAARQRHQHDLPGADDQPQPGA